MARHRPNHDPRRLTARERDVIDCLLEGDTNAIIAEKLAISVETAKRHLYRICDKTGMSTRLEVVCHVYAQRLAAAEAEAREARALLTKALGR